MDERRRHRFAMFHWTLKIKKIFLRRGKIVPHEKGVEESVDPIVVEKETVRANDVVPQTEERTVEAVAECRICCELKALTSNGSFHNDTAFTCQHITEVCLSCLITYITIYISSSSSHEKTAFELQCPLCPGILQHHDIQLITKEHPDVYAPWDAHLLSAELATMEDFQHCPHPNCDSGFLCDTPPSPDCPLPCPNCQRPICAKHGTWHNDLSCDQFQKKTEHWDRTQRYLRGTKKCPGCGVHIEKVGGCGRVMCTKCFREFKWESVAFYGKSEEDGLL
ncbi:hypothetical protein HDU85_001651 [Gaertneriomyces sp. JEL0708]|nr:hypothetical protein HDU85_001651 [Gaertneriomyces sp. JEL0708]